LLELTDTERETLTRWSRHRKSAQALALRCRIVLECADGSSNKDVAARLGIAVATVGKWRGRFVAERLDGLTDEPRPGAPRTVSDDAVEAVIVKTLESTPRDATHWSTRSMAQDSGLCQSTVSRIWRTFGLQPHRAETFKLSTDPLFVDKVRDVVGLYLDPPERALVANREAHALIRQALTGSGDIDPHDGVLTVRLDPLPTRRATTAIAQLCEHLTATKTRYPGTDLILRYEVKTRP
jgi:transposase